MDVITQLELCLYDQLDIASLLLASLLFIAIPTLFEFLNFYLFLVYVCMCMYVCMYVRTYICMYMLHCT